MATAARWLISRWRAQLLLYLSAYWAYNATRWTAAGEVPKATAHTVPIYALFPVAPPRLAGIGIIDTISDKSETSLNSHVATSFYNPFAAVPSLHVGFAFAVGIALAVVARRWWSRTLALLWGPTVALAVVATGNHFLFDIAAGLLVAAAGFLVGRAASRQRSHLRAAGCQTSDKSILWVPSARP
jgi:membrane-associated phospholipid phosphatase